MATKETTTPSLEELPVEELEQMVSVLERNLETAQAKRNESQLEYTHLRRILDATEEDVRRVTLENKKKERELVTIQEEHAMNLGVRE